LGRAAFTCRRIDKLGWLGAKMNNLSVNNSQEDAQLRIGELPCRKGQAQHNFRQGRCSK
jgi:hypothetical protein